MFQDNLDNNPFLVILVGVLTIGLFFLILWLIFRALKTTTAELSHSLIHLYNDDDLKQELVEMGSAAKKNKKDWQDVANSFRDEPEPVEPETEPEPEYIPPPIPDKLRTQHQMILASSGHGKTQAMQEMLLQDIQSSDTVIVIDSQEGMLERLLHVVPMQRLMYLDPTNTDHPLAIGAFDLKTKDEIKVQNAISLYEFMFSALGTTMTTKQSTLYRYLSRLLFEMPDANLNTALEILKRGAPLQYIPKLPDTAQLFFREQFMGQGFRTTRDEVSQRLYTLLVNPAIARMFNAPESRVNIPQAIKDNKVILINTAQSVLGTQGATIFGRYCLAQIAMEILARPEKTNRVYLYVDEAQEYFSGDEIIRRLFEQGRKRGLCMICAFHSLTQIDPDLMAIMRTNTAIKMAGGVNSSDATVIHKDMGIDAGLLSHTPEMTFWLSAKGHPTNRYFVTPQLLEKQPQLPTGTIREIKDYNLYKYGYTPAETVPEQEPEIKENWDGDDAEPFDPEK